MSFAKIPLDQPVLIAGPTASGKSALALELAQAQNRDIINADALQVYSNWRVLTARPTIEDELQVQHHLYGHVAHDVAYSVGHWIREVSELITKMPAPIIVGGTGLYFTSLTTGLSNIPAVPPNVRELSEQKLAVEGLEILFDQLDQKTKDRIDPNNPARVQRAWEVLNTTGRGIADWQDETPAPLFPLHKCRPIVIDAPKEWLTPRIEQRFDLMLQDGALEEAEQNLDLWDSNIPSSRAIGAPELISYLKGECTLADVRETVIIATRQYAKRQRSWFRSRMSDWEWLASHELSKSDI